MEHLKDDPSLRHLKIWIRILSRDSWRIWKALFYCIALSKFRISIAIFLKKIPFLGDM